MKADFQVEQDCSGSPDGTCPTYALGYLSAQPAPSGERPAIPGVPGRKIGLFRTTNTWTGRFSPEIHQPTPTA